MSAIEARSLKLRRWKEVAQVPEVISKIASSLVSAGRQVDAALSVGSLENARSELAHRERIARLRIAVDEAYRIRELDRSA